MIWISLTSKYHKRALEGVQKRPLQINMISGTIYYIVIPFIIIYLISRYTKTRNEGLIMGALLALLMFATFDITNKTVFSDYPYWYVAMDMVGGITSILISLYLASMISTYVN